MGPDTQQSPNGVPKTPNKAGDEHGSSGSTPKRPAMEPNVLNVVLGDLPIKPWYPSFYPEELMGRRADRLYVCRWCFKYSKDILPSLGHGRVCKLKDAAPPGTQIYEKDGYSIYELDGEEHKLYAQNLSLFAKLFLDTKSVFYDVTTFLYYLLVRHDDPADDPAAPRQQVIGFFSKEKMSWDNNNLACILVFPPWQRRGLGQMLMGASYELSRREGRLGGPEKPLSELGRKGYTAYWSATIARFVLSAPTKKTVTLRSISEATYILLEDIVATLKEMGVLEHRKKGQAEAVINKTVVRAWAARNGVSMTPPVDSDAFIEWEDEESEEEEGE
ncbi:hypothetical protein K490DRAFT_55983 [Saccharata proteae CBS 121410]|uniref:histone acetyltransferase n=1 Tax=Saccharata proteae CBS 121410 TaxID=1314787 RepID=A0A9P4HXE5_9PEZI|nr:hypothetical protein K490DRAFT_55983 [Saccharata proteae CBS 121410]